MSKADRILGALGEKLGCDGSLEEIDEAIRDELDRDPGEEVQAKQQELIKEYEQIMAFCQDMEDGLRQAAEKHLYIGRRRMIDFARELQQTCRARKQELLD